MTDDRCTQLLQSHVTTRPPGNEGLVDGINGRSVCPKLRFVETRWGQTQTSETFSKDTYEKKVYIESERKREKQGKEGEKKREGM